ncbi:diguanylate cyclase [Colwellia sp. E2M01]|uniref:diguanylate cyclase n=1 Tax=Colwellia sp. E2M01 TaxID=2841561 RepID=UPI001C09B09B|nr:diguanylate cyclase [Colwellia sp. E2M01]MBU2871487.1 diguanylate cyclase [Colwellia sp. E2M01]
MKLDNEYRILVVDDAQDTQMLLDYDLSAAGYLVTCCDNGEDALTILKAQKVDLILLDMYMPGLSGLETLVKAKADDLTADIPVIMLSASTDEDEVVAALEYGAGDYVIKPYVAKVLLARIRTAIRLKEKTAQLEYLAKTDFLTGINNRGNFFELSTNALSLANRTGQMFVVAMFDIDFFKPINDNYGHYAGDQVLRVFSRSLSEAFRGYDIIGRVGGEEFAVCLPNTSKENAYIACERFRTSIEQLDINIITDNEEETVINITVSTGLVLAENKTLKIDALMKQADIALYYAKEHGRNQVVDASLICNKELEGNNQSKSDKDIMQTKLNEAQEGNIDGIDYAIGVNNVLGDASLFQEVLVMFYQDHHQDADKLYKAMTEQDNATIKHLAHTLKGVACSVGAMELFEITKTLDIAINENQMSAIDDLYTKLSLELNRVMQAIKSVLDVS